MPTIGLILKAVEILAPLVEDLVKALSKGEMPAFVTTLPSPLKSEVALAAKKAGLR